MSQLIIDLVEKLTTDTGLPTSVAYSEETVDHIVIESLGSAWSEPSLSFDPKSVIQTTTVSINIKCKRYSTLQTHINTIRAAFNHKVKYDLTNTLISSSYEVGYIENFLNDSRKHSLNIDYQFVHKSKPIITL